MSISNETAKKSTEIRIVDTRTGEVTKIVQLQDTQVGTSNDPKNLVVTDSVTINRNLSITSGSVTVTNGNLTVVGGNLSLTSGSVTVPSGNLSVSGSLFSRHITGSLTKTINGESFLVATGNHLTVTSGSSTGQVQLGTSFVSMTLLSDFTTTSTTRTNSNFSFSVNANETWEVEFDGAFGCSTANGVQVGWDAPAGSTAFSRVFGCTANAGTFSSTCSTTINALITTMTFSTVAGPAARYGRIAATITIAGTAGTVTLQMAVVTVGTARMYAGSHFSAKRVDGV